MLSKIHSYRLLGTGHINYAKIAHQYLQTMQSMQSLNLEYP